ncbi:potassium-transporting ATPase subunit KdpC [Paenibacillus mendelii]|uniref:Potassium-transporting ATPase KdpC subunit n=1 Tax=Paenibacillus mendelii TaxID=206163 RepID=A0ABV6J8F4_9BACL|nr:potassium-transporting ATPase subunit KdpC [Paenibacillus mendelii]MCQ6559514.1 potassium-transporting ATPase subunit KdpC [Paenibacillus mendelii]
MGSGNVNGSRGGAAWSGSVWAVAARAGIVFIILCGLVYPLVSTGAAQLLFPHQANGSLLENQEGQVVGSELIGQQFTDPAYFQGRISSIDYKAEGSGTNNYGPSNADLLARVHASIEEWKKANPDVSVDRVPIALLTNSGSGLDPHITPESAVVQIPRISKLTGVSADQLTKLVDQYTEGRDLGVFGDPRVNVLKLNLALKEYVK